MPLQIRPSYPYRRYGSQAQQPPAGSDFEAGWKIGQQIGGGIGTVGEAIIKGQQQQAQDAAANQLMNQQDASAMAKATPTYEGADPNDPDPDPTGLIDPTTGADVSDLNATHTGGLAEYKLRQQFQQNQLNDQISQAKAQDYAARASGTGRYAPKPVPGARTVTGGGSSSAWIQGGGQGGQGGGTNRSGKPQPYQANSSDIENDPTSDDPTKIATDFDATYGQKGLYSKFMAGISSGNVVADQKTGNYTLVDPKTGNPIASISGSDAATWVKRINASRNKQGMSALSVPNPLTGAYPNSTEKPGTINNPYVANSNLDFRSVPYDSYVIGPMTGNKPAQKTRRTQ